MIANLVLFALVLGVALLFLMAARKLRRSRLEEVEDRKEPAEPTEVEAEPQAAAPVPRPEAPRAGQAITPAPRRPRTSAPEADKQGVVIPFPVPPARAEPVPEPAPTPTAPPPQAVPPPAPPEPAPPRPRPVRPEPPARPAAPLPARPAPARPAPARPAPARPVPAPPAPVPRPVAEPVEKPVPAAPRDAPRLAKLREERTALRAGLEKTRGGFVARIASLLRGRREIPADLLTRLEEVLFGADIGVRTSQKLLQRVSEKLSSKELGDAQAVMAFLREEATRILAVPAPPAAPSSRPYVVLITGVNGTGKTTTIGKLAARHRQQGKKVVLVAGDTFRAAAVDQLEIWARRVGAEFFGGKEGADPSSVIFDGIRRALAQDADIALCDTAGRLHTKTNLMEELQKVRRVAGKAHAGAPHETLLVLDATTGQNAIAQAQTFKQAIAVDGLVLTKLDGTAKGGVVLGVCDELALPIRYLGLGERVEDLRDFDPIAFADALLGDLDGDGAASDGPEGAEANK